MQPHELQELLRLNPNPMQQSAILYEQLLEDAGRSIGDDRQVAAELHHAALALCECMFGGADPTDDAMFQLLQRLAVAVTRYGPHAKAFNDRMSGD